jgi:hypothetical protein
MQRDHGRIAGIVVAIEAAEASGNSAGGCGNDRRIRGGRRSGRGGGFGRVRSAAAVRTAAGSNHGQYTSEMPNPKPHPFIPHVLLDPSCLENLKPQLTFTWM